MRLSTASILGVGAVLGGVAACRHAAALRVDPQYRSPVLLLPDLPLVHPLAALSRSVPARPGRIADGVVVTDRMVPGRDGPIRVWIHDATRAGDEPTPAYLHIHGGGFVLGDPVSSHERCSTIAAELGIRVVSVDYRLAPEHPFPAALHDCVDVLRWMAETADAEGIDASRIAVGGESAGGGLAACTAQAATDLGLPLAFQLLVYPMLDDRTRARVDDRGRYVWSAASNRYGWRSYLGDVDPATPYAAGARRADLSGLPPAWIGVGALDLFHAEDVAYADRLRADGVAVELVEVPGAYHGFDALRPTAPGVQAFERRMREALRTGLGLPA